jgi:hypothetical protein
VEWAVCPPAWAATSKPFFSIFFQSFRIIVTLLLRPFRPAGRSGNAVLQRVKGSFPTVVFLTFAVHLRVKFADTVGNILKNPQ